jgi:hypothetical protein
MLLPLLLAVRRRFPAANVTVAASQRSALLLDQARLPAVAVRTPSWFRDGSARSREPGAGRVLPQSALTWLLPPLALALVATREAPWLGPPPSAGWLLFSGLVTLPYLTYDGHWWSLWLSFTQYLPLYALLAVGAAGALRRTRRLRHLPYTAE